jgi:hypothetical protein
VSRQKLRVVNTKLADSQSGEFAENLVPVHAELLKNGEQACKPDFVRRAGVAACAPWRSFL